MLVPSRRRPLNCRHLQLVVLLVCKSRFECNPVTRGRILGRNWDKSLKSIPPCCLQSTLLTGFTLTPFEKKWFELKLVCNVNIVYGNLKSENSQDYAQKPQQNFMFMNSASGRRGGCTYKTKNVSITSLV